MVEDDANSPIQVAHMEAAVLLAECIEKATDLGFSLVACGGSIDVHPWNGKPLEAAVRQDGLFTARYLTNLIDWLDGVAFGRTHSGVS